MAAAHVLAAQPGEKVIDLAAAPGGKATHLAGLMQNKGLLVANEIHSQRVWDLAENLERCGVTNAIITNESPRRLADFFGEYFDRVLIDAPCSGEGMFRKSEQARKEWNPELPSSCAFRQSAIFDQAARLVKPGGCIAYTTCTFSPDENEAVVYKFLDQHPEFELKEIERSPGMQSARPDWIGLSPEHQLNRAVRIWPQNSAGEGHFIALLVKTSGYDPQPMRKPASLKFPRRQNIGSKELSAARKCLANFASTNLNLSFSARDIDLAGSYVYRSPEHSPNLEGLKVIHPGWWLGTVQKGRFMPSHALAMGIQAGDVRQTLPLQLGDRRLSAYLAGEIINCPGDNGWMLVTLDGFPLGWGKRTQEVVKNYYPRGLRKPYR